DSGEVLARGNVVLEGYWRQPEATAEALEGGWFHTGDGGLLDDENYLTISDRKKDVIITGGENVSSIEVEDCLYQLDGIAECAVIGIPDAKWGETIKAVVVTSAGSRLDAAAVIAHCKQRLAGYKAPTSVDFVDAIPRTATGKVQKYKLREPYWRDRNRQVN
ncbi:MAG TPA: AMP-dependent synthetase, partial [Mycobacteriales bacterium]|nr:AMP-dependent synthetase [Mycobacteriales bacterium]